MPGGSGFCAEAANKTADWKARTFSHPQSLFLAPPATAGGQRKAGSWPAGTRSPAYTLGHWVLPAPGQELPATPPRQLLGMGRACALLGAACSQAGWAGGRGDRTGCSRRKERRNKERRSSCQMHLQFL